MYREYWGFKDKPFENTPDPRFFYPSSQHEEALSRLLFVVREGKGAGLLTGVFGCGKTLVAQTLMDNIDKDTYKMAVINNPLLTPIEFLRAIAVRLGATNLPDRRSELLTDVILETIENILNDNFRDGKQSLIIIDEMHVVEDRTIFEQLRMLLNFQLRDRFLVSLILMGQPELRRHLDTNKQFSQRIAVRFHLEAMNEADTARYVAHRLRVAGATDHLFSAETVRFIHTKTGGIPRRINQLCDLLLMMGMHMELKEITEDVAHEIATDVEM